jgi:hypothetical protein
VKRSRSRKGRCSEVIAGGAAMGHEVQIARHARVLEEMNKAGDVAFVLFVVSLS